MEAFKAADSYVSRLEREAAENPKAFYGNKNLPADGHERIGAGLRAARGLVQRLEAINRGK
jgi:hypothetical protein